MERTGRESKVVGRGRGLGKAEQKQRQRRVGRRQPDQGRGVVRERDQAVGIGAEPR
jgi:hypothetical protein